MTTKATRDVLDMAVRPVTDFVLDGTGTSSIDGTPIGVTTPDVGCFTNLKADNLTVTNSVDFTGATITGLNSFYADLAEYYEADADLQAGTVVKIGGEREITATDTDADPEVFGVISDAPAIVINGGSVKANGYHVPMVLVGRSPCRVIGPVKKGQRLVATEGGLSRALGLDEVGVSFARALESNDDAGEKLVEVAVVTVN